MPPLPPPEPREKLESVPPDPWTPSPIDRARRWLRTHGRKLWWLHSTYALGLGVGVVLFARRGFEHARWLGASASAAWLLAVVLFRAFGSGKKQELLHRSGPKARLPFYAVTYALKNLYQGMLFFLVPFAWQSTTLLSKNGWFVLVVGACAVLSTLDIVFDRVVFKYRSFAALLHAVALFGCVVLAVPAFFPGAHALTALLLAAGVMVVGFFSLHIRWDKDGARWALALAPATALAVLAAYLLRGAIPAVPAHLAHGAVGTAPDEQGRLAVEASVVRAAALNELVCVTRVGMAPGDRLVHVWRRDDAVMHREQEGPRVTLADGTTLVRSALAGSAIPADTIGRWTVDVETEDGQLVGRVGFAVEP